MCINIEIVLPTIHNFLLLYSLRCGSIVILVWTIFRCLFCILFFTMAILEFLVNETPPFGAWLMRDGYQVPSDLTQALFYCFLTLLIGETTLLVFTGFLGYGIYFEKTHLIKYYLICRFTTWVVEVLFITVLCLIHKYLIGYYLCILLFVVLEFYSFIVVYSYLVSIHEMEAEAVHKNEDDED